MTVRANSLYYFDPSGLDVVRPTGNAHHFAKGDRVRVVNIHGCPKAGTMGQCYIVPADAKKDDRGCWDKDFAMVSTGSLQREPLPAPTLDYDEKRDGDKWEGFRRFPDGSVLNSNGYDEDNNRRQYW